jgi:hypothetical protein
MPTSKSEVPKEVMKFKFEKQPHGGEKSKLCCWYALYHYANGNFMDLNKFKKEGAAYYAKETGLSEEDALDLLLDGNDPGLAIKLKKQSGKAHVMNLRDRHFYTVREIEVEVDVEGSKKKKEKQWWSFDSYNFDWPQKLDSLAKAPGKKIF